MGSSSRITAGVKKTLSLKQPQVGYLIRELRQLAGLTQEQFALRLGVAYATINRWENARVQPSSLALQQIRAVIDELGESPSPQLREGSRNLLLSYLEIQD
ncbi:helix-turn-helix domain-containing protein [Oscillatoria acuminata]|uniref:Putative transcriptional regulator n=1 Tax=Oscillatoria acuminata PCC 6304 TaxID=56110 RepID=K9TP10_9CYAN|nr:helix-turn-helix transcriptional regulator [Oscillatoria acuminata]AFY84602.1 putative transcriptional regulator [Oscillatoria acuminata PCC 6304]